MAHAVDDIDGHGPSNEMSQATAIEDEVLAIYWGEPERIPHWSVVDVYNRASRCARSVNKKIRYKSHSSFVYNGASRCVQRMNKKI